MNWGQCPLSSKMDKNDKYKTICITNINTYTYTYTYTYAYAYTYTYTHTYTHTHTYTCTLYVYLYLYVYIYTYVYMFSYTYTYTYTYMCMHIIHIIDFLFRSRFYKRRVQQKIRNNAVITILSYCWLLIQVKLTINEIKEWIYAHKGVGCAYSSGQAILALTHWGRYKLDAISQTTFSNEFHWMKMIEFRLQFYIEAFSQGSD